MRPLLRLALAAAVLAGCAGPALTSTPGPLPSPLTLPTASRPPLPAPLPTASLPPASATANSTPEPSPTVIPFPFDVGPDEPVRGSADAPVTVIQYGDYDGPYDALLEPALRRVLANHPDEVRLVWRAFPVVEVNDKAYYAAVAAEAAGRQGKFWEMHDLLFDTYLDWTTLPPEEFWGLLDDYADQIGLDPERLADDLAEAGVLQAVADDYRRAREVGIPGTPALVINRTPYTGPLEYGVLERTIRLELLKERQYSQYPDTVIDPQLSYSAVLHTVLGDISLALDARQAPVAVNSFVFLAREGWYDGNLFYRVVPGQAAFTGDPSGTGLGGPGYLFADEILPDLQFDRPGVVALDNAGPDTNGSRFFISLAPLPQFDGQYTIIGRVTGGLAIFSRFAPRDPDADPGALDGDRLETLTIVEN